MLCYIIRLSYYFSLDTSLLSDIRPSILSDYQLLLHFCIKMKVFRFFVLFFVYFPPVVYKHLLFFRKSRLFSEFIHCMRTQLHHIVCVMDSASGHDMPSLRPFLKQCAKQKRHTAWYAFLILAMGLADDFCTAHVRTEDFRDDDGAVSLLVVL